MDDAFGHWLAGFVDGEGCFAVVPQNGGYGCRLTVQVRADDGAVLEEICARTGLGMVTTVSRAAAAGVNPQVAWLVRAKADCQAAVLLFERYPLRAKKARDFAIWREAVAEWSLKRGHNRYAPQDWGRLADLKLALSEIKRFDAEACPLPDPSHEQTALVV
jgi:hypothetical protein